MIWNYFDSHAIILGCLLTFIEIVSINFIRPEKRSIIENIHFSNNKSLHTRRTPTDDIIKMYINGVCYHENTSFSIDKKQVNWFDSEVQIANDDEITIEYSYYYYPWHTWFRWIKLLFVRIGQKFAKNG
jgi:hypothetical protein